MNPFRYDAYDKVLSFICSAMKSDADGESANFFKALNNLSATEKLHGKIHNREMNRDDILGAIGYSVSNAALIGYTNNNQKWDYKPKLRRANILLEAPIPNNIGTLTKGDYFLVYSNYE